MSRFTPEEIEYLQNQRLGRLATTNGKGDLHVVPVGFRYPFLAKLANHESIEPLR